MWLNPTNPETFPEGFIDALDDPTLLQLQAQHNARDSIEGRLRARMQADALRPLASLEDEDAEEETAKVAVSKTPYSEEELKEAEQFLRLNVSELPRMTFELQLTSLSSRHRTDWSWSSII